MAIAPPRVILGVRNHARRPWVELDASYQRQQVRLAVHDRRPEAPFPQSAAPPVGEIKVLHVTPAHRLEDFAVAAIECTRRQQMEGNRCLTPSPP